MATPRFVLSSLSPTHLIVPISGNVPRYGNKLVSRVGVFGMARRALLTDRERELIEGGDNVDDDLRYQAISRVRRKINDELTTDVEILREAHPDLYFELREVVCEPKRTTASSGRE